MTWLRSIVIAVALLSSPLAPLAFASDPPVSPIQTLVAMTRTSLTDGGLEKKSIETDDGTLTWFEGGTGRTVVLLHGSNDQAGSWAAAAKALVPSWRVVVLDLPGHGDSAPAAGPLTCEMMKRGVEAMIEAAAPKEQVVVVGNSMGGWLALLWALDHPDRVAGIVLEDAGALNVPPEERINLIPKDRDEARAIMTKVQGPVAALIPAAILDDLVVQTKDSPMTRMDGASFETCLLDGRLDAISAPTVVMWGSIDGVLPPDYGRKIAAAIPNASFVLLDGCGHVPHLHCANVMVPKLVDALAGIESKSEKMTRSGRRAAR